MVNKRLAAYEFTGVCGTRIGSRKKPAGVNRLQRYGALAISHMGDLG
jgi:hypothetical protein